MRSTCAAAAVAAVFVGACGASDDAGSTLVVFAAASLTDAFADLGEVFEQANPGLDVTFNFASSSQLANQLVDGAPADVFAAADERQMTVAVDAGEIAGQPVTLATNSLAILVERGNPLGISGVEDLADPALIVVVGDPAAPIGAYTEEMFSAAGVEVTPDSLEENVRGVVGKVVSGEADAGVVYVSDVAAAGDRAGAVAIPGEINVVADLPIAVAARAPNPEDAAAFVAFVTSEHGQRILAEHGFGGRT